MRLQMALLAATATVLGASAANAAQVEIRDAVARVTVIPENRADIKVEVVRASGRLPLDVRTQGDRTVIEGHLQRKIRSCKGAGENVHVTVRDVGDVAWADMPQIVVRTPRDAKIDAEGAVYGTVGRSASLELENAGCGDWVVANVESRMRISQAGSGDTRTGSAGAARLRIAGSGDIATAEIRGGLDVNIAGSGGVNVASIQGPLDVSVAGSGDVRVGGGRAGPMSVSIAGSGDVNFDGVADSLKARIAGSGDVNVREVRGEISKSVMGSGSIHVGN